jgi:hypothetical protein
MAYVVPAAADLKVRYPAFAAVDDDTVTYWITDAQRYVTEAWTETDYAVGLMALAAHNMALAGYGTDAAALSDVPAGVTRMKSGALELGFSDQMANARGTGSFDSTRYGTEYANLLARNRGGPIVSSAGVLPPGVDCSLWQ